MNLDVKSNITCTRMKEWKVLHFAANESNEKNLRLWIIFFSLPMFVDMLRVSNTIHVPVK